MYTLITADDNMEVKGAKVRAMVTTITGKGGRVVVKTPKGNYYYCKPTRKGYQKIKILKPSAHPWIKK